MVYQWVDPRCSHCGQSVDWNHQSADQYHKDSILPHIGAFKQTVENYKVYQVPSIFNGGKKKKNISSDVGSQRRLCFNCWGPLLKYKPFNINVTPCIRHWVKFQCNWSWAHFLKPAWQKLQRAQKSITGSTMFSRIMNCVGHATIP